MERYVSMEDISDGKLYSRDDMVKAGCNDCKGCYACCEDMGNSIVLNPLDMSMMVTNLKCTFEDLLKDKVDLNVVDKVILPNLKMTGSLERCSFLSQEGRCSIHPFRPSICRLFPLGRLYEDQSFQYFLQVHECKNQNRTKVKVRKWIDTPDLRKNEQFIIQWHYFLKNLQYRIEEEQDDSKIKQWNLLILQHFYGNAFQEGEDFYDQFQQRLQKVKEIINI